MERQFCGTVYILEGDKVLLIKHRKLGKWMPAGGHIEPNEIPHEAAIREAKEETGLDIEIISQENLTIERHNAHTIYRPYLMLLQVVPKYGNTAEHRHMDLVYLGRRIGGELIQNEEETGGIRWWTWEELQMLKPDVDIFVETLQVIKHLFSESALKKGL